MVTHVWTFKAPSSGNWPCHAIGISRSGRILHVNVARSGRVPPTSGNRWLLGAQTWSLEGLPHVNLQKWAPRPGNPRHTRRAPRKGRPSTRYFVMLKDIKISIGQNWVPTSGDTPWLAPANSRCGRRWGCHCRVWAANPTASPTLGGGAARLGREVVSAARLRRCHIHQVAFAIRKQPDSRYGCRAEFRSE